RDSGEIWGEIRREGDRPKKAPAAAPRATPTVPAPPARPPQTDDDVLLDADDEFAFPGSGEVLKPRKDRALEVPDADELWPEEDNDRPLRAGKWSTLDTPLAEEPAGAAPGGPDRGVKETPSPARRPIPPAVTAPPASKTPVTEATADVDPEEEPEADTRSASIVPLTRQTIRQDAIQAFGHVTGGPSLSR